MAKNETMMVPAGKAIGGGPLWHVRRNGEVIGTVKGITCGWVAHKASAGGNGFTFHDTRDEAFATAMAW